MTSFQDTLATLPAVEHLQRLELYAGSQTQPVWVVENRPGSQGSLAVYYKVCIDHGGLNPAAARQALALFGEHSEAARARPGSHPNIDFLFRLIQRGDHLAAKAVPRD